MGASGVGNEQCDHINAIPPLFAYPLSSHKATNPIKNAEKMFLHGDDDPCSPVEVKSVVAGILVSAEVLQSPIMLSAWRILQEEL